MTMDRRKLILGVSTFATLGVYGVTESKQPGSDLPKERVQGIGGLFFRSQDPKALAAWYQQHLGVDPIPTDYNQSPWQQLAGPTAFAPFPKDTDYFGSPQQSWMMEYPATHVVRFTGR
jgi:hypothetical protein